MRLAIVFGLQVAVYFVVVCVVGIITLLGLNDSTTTLSINAVRRTSEEARRDVLAPLELLVPQMQLIRETIQRDGLACSHVFNRSITLGATAGNSTIRVTLENETQPTTAVAVPNVAAFLPVHQLLLPVAKFNDVLEYVYQSFELPGSGGTAWLDCGISAVESFSPLLIDVSRARSNVATYQDFVQHYVALLNSNHNPQSSSNSSSRMGLSVDPTYVNVTQDVILDWTKFTYIKFARSLMDPLALRWSPAEIYLGPGQTTASFLITLTAVIQLRSSLSSTSSTLPSASAVAMMDVNTQFFSNALLALGDKYPGVDMALYSLREGWLYAWTNPTLRVVRTYNVTTTKSGSDTNYASTAVVETRQEARLDNDTGVHRLDTAVAEAKKRFGCPQDNTFRVCPSASIVPLVWITGSTINSVQRVKHLDMELVMLLVTDRARYFDDGDRRMGVTIALACIFLTGGAVAAILLARWLASWTAELAQNLKHISRLQGDKCRWTVSLVDDVNAITDSCHDVNQQLLALRDFVPQHIQEQVAAGSLLSSVTHQLSHQFTSVTSDEDDFCMLLSGSDGSALTSLVGDLQPVHAVATRPLPSPTAKAADAAGRSPPRSDAVAIESSPVSAAPAASVGGRSPANPLGPAAATARRPSLSDIAGSDRGTDRSSGNRRLAASALGKSFMQSVVAIGGVKKMASVLIVNVRNFSVATHGLTVGQFAAVHEAIVNQVDAATRVCRGSVDSFHGDHFLLTFNAASNAPSHRRNAADCALQIQEAIAQIHVPVVEADDAARPRLFLSAGIGSSSCVVGNFGVPGLMKLTLFGPAIGRAVALETMCADIQRQIAEDPSVDGAPVPQTLMMCAPDVRQDDLAAVFVLQCVTITRNWKVLMGIGHPASSKAAAAALIAAPVRCHAAAEGEGDEWMYELAASEKANEFSAVNAAFAAALASKFDDALGLLEMSEADDKSKNAARASAKALRSWLSTGSATTNAV